MRIPFGANAKAGADSPKTLLSPSLPSSSVNVTPSSLANVVKFPHVTATFSSIDSVSFSASPLQLAGPCGDAELLTLAATELELLGAAEDDDGAALLDSTMTELELDVGGTAPEIDEIDCDVAQ